MRATLATLIAVSFLSFAPVARALTRPDAPAAVEQDIALAWRAVETKFEPGAPRELFATEYTRDGRLTKVTLAAEEAARRTAYGYYSIPRNERYMIVIAGGRIEDARRID